jgi:phage baseplate assembly protein W
MAIDTTYGLAYPMGKNPLGFMYVSTGLDVVKSDLMILLLTNPGERVMLPNYGTPLRKYFFQPNDQTTANEVKEVIAKAISTWEPRVTIENISVGLIDNSKLNSEDDLTEEESILYIKIDFYDPNHIAQIESLVLNLPTTQMGGA